MDTVLEKPVAPGLYSKAARAEAASLPPGPPKRRVKPRVMEFPTPAAVMKELGIKPPAKSAWKPVIKRAPLPSEIRAKLKHVVANGLLTQAQSDSIWEQLLPSLRQLAREDFDAFAELVCVNDETGEPVVQAPIHKCWTKLRKEHKRLLIWAHCESAKCLAAGERVLLSTGEWVPVESMLETRQISLLDPVSMKLRKAWAEPVRQNGRKPVVRIKTRSGRVLRITENHPLFTIRGWTEAATIKVGDSIAAARTLPDVSNEDGLSADDAELLGYLVGDGGLTQTSRVSFSNIDQGILKRVAELAGKHGWALKHHDRCTYSITRENGRGSWDGLESPSRWISQFGVSCLSKHKRVPEQVFRSNNKSIAAFLAGYFACDGSVAPKGCSLVSASPGMLEDCRLLLSRLGIVSRVRYMAAKCGGRVFDAWRMTFYGPDARLFAQSIPVVGDKRERLDAFKVPERLTVQGDGVPNDWIHLHQGWRPVDHDIYKIHRTVKFNHRKKVQKYLSVKPDVVVERLASDAIFWDEVYEVVTEEPQMTYALTINDSARCFLHEGVLSHNTTQISTLNTVWELGIDPTLRFVILSNTAEQAENIVRNIAGYVERNAEVRAIFPALRPDPNGPWTNKQLRVIRTGTARDPSVRAVGVHGALTGGRVDRLIVDDILDPENTDTDGNRKKVEQWYKAVAAGRLTGRSRVLVVGTAYHSQDLLHTLALQKNFKWFRFPVVRADGTLSWPEQWPKKRVDERRAELGPAEFARQMLCKARDDDEARFKQAWIDQALTKGDGLTMIHRIDTLPEGCMTFTGVDLAAAQNKKSDNCSFFTFIEDKKGFRRILDITHGKFTGPKIIETLHDLYRRYHSFLVVESNGVQRFILQFAEEGTNLPTVPFNTGAAKWDPKLGVEGLAIELFNGKWIFPNQAGVCTKEMDIFITQMLYYSPRSHTGDILMSSYFARDWARRVMNSGNTTTGGTAECRILGGGEAPALDRIPPENTGFSVMED